MAKRSMPAVVQVPVRTPSPGHTPSTPIPPPVVAPPVTSLPLTINLLKDPTGLLPTGPAKEGKAIRRKVKEKVEKDVPKTTIRKKKTSATATQSISIDGRTSSENDAPIGSKHDRKKKNSQTSSNSEAKSDGSKEPSENDERNGPKMNREIAKSFYKQMLESQRARKRSDDARLETMPESSQINISARIYKKKGKKPSKTPLDANLFKPNGDPVWLVSEVETVGANGAKAPNAELAAAMAEEGVELDEKTWYEHITEYMGCTMSKGPALPEDYKFNAFAPEETLELNNEYVTPNTVIYNTCKNMDELNENAIKRFAAKEEGMEGRKTHTQDTTTTETTTVTLPLAVSASQELYQLKTCVMSMVTFNVKPTKMCRYDRSQPIASVQRALKRMNNMRSMEQTTQESK